MRFFTVENRVRPFFHVYGGKAPRVVSPGFFRGMTSGMETNIFFCLPLGNTFRRAFLEGDMDKTVTLEHGTLAHPGGAGTVLVAQEREEALKDQQALVLLSVMPGEGGVVSYTGLGQEMPRILDSIPNNGVPGGFEYLLLFDRGQGLLVERTGQLGNKPARLALKWDGRRLDDGLERRRRRVRRRSRKPA